jgi:diadenosine tetraphosphate (Ap4A) HIT family hydrolase
VIAASPFERMFKFWTGAFAYAVWDEFPVAPGHALVVPKREVASIFSLDPDEYAGLWQVVREVAEMVRAQVHCDGLNIGVNIGEAAGQSVRHAHVHVIPRFTGDHPSPRGGVRAIVPGKGDYKL